VGPANEAVIPKGIVKWTPSISAAAAIEEAEYAALDGIANPRIGPSDRGRK
jgi:hypothetical protein